jgi:hypothetical protein
MKFDTADSITRAKRVLGVIQDCESRIFGDRSKAQKSPRCALVNEPSMALSGLAKAILAGSFAGIHKLKAI